MTRPSRRTTFLERAALAASPYGKTRRFLQETIWQIDLNGLDRWRRMGVMLLRVLYLVGRSFYSSRAQIQASSLTYVTMLALVPFFAVAFSIFQSFYGLETMRERVQEFLIDLIATTDESRKMIQERIPELISGVQNNVKSGGGVTGAAIIFLALTVVTMLGSIEKALNDIWGVKRARSFMQKFVVYWAVATLGPVFLGIGLGVGSNVYDKVSSFVSPGHLWDRLRGKHEVEKPRPTYHGSAGALAAEFEKHRTSFATPGEVFQFIATGQRPDRSGPKLVSLLLTTIAFTLLYQMMPNTRVRWGPAITGGVIAALIWQFSRWGLTKGSSALVSYNTIYGGIATIPILMFWLYLSWLVVLLGAELTFAIQNMRAQGLEELALDASERTRETVALRLMAAICDAFDRGAPPPALSELAQRVGAPTVLCTDILYHLCEEQFLRELELERDERGFVPGRPIDRVTFSDILRSLREKKGTAFKLQDSLDARLIERTLDDAVRAEDSVAGMVTFERVVREIRPRPAASLNGPEHKAPGSESAPTSSSEEKKG